MPRVVVFVMVVAVVVGLIFRIQHVNRMLFYGDESFTALRVSGHVFADFKQLFDGRVHELSEIQSLQCIDAEKGIGDTVNGLAVEEPQHPPLFYILEYWWAKAFGCSVTALRTLPLIFGAATLPLCYWLAFELFGSVIVACTTTALMALSPFFVLYSSLAREYSMWAMLVCLSSILFLRALRSNSWLAWTIYGSIMVATIYCFSLSLLVLFAHGIVVVATQRRRLVAFTSTAAVALLAFAPWLLVAYNARSAIVGSLSPSGAGSYPVRETLSKLAFNIGAVLWDLEYLNLKLAVVAAVLIGVTILGAVYVWRHERQARAFVITLVAVPLGALLVYDLLKHSHLALAARYSTPAWIGIVLIVGAYLGRMLETGRRVWLLGFFFVVAAEATSSAASVRAVAWWHNNDNFPVSGVVAAVSASGRQPLLVSETNYELLVLSHYLEKKTRLLLFQRGVPFPIPAGALLLAPSQATLAQFRRQSSYRLEVLPVAPLASEVVQEFHKRLMSASHGNGPESLAGTAQNDAFLLLVHRIPQSQPRTGRHVRSGAPLQEGRRAQR